MLQVAQKVDLSSTFPNVARSVAACIVTWYGTFLTNFHNAVVLVAFKVAP